MLVYPDVRAAVAWLSAAFGFPERVRIGEDHRSQLHDHLRRYLEPISAGLRERTGRGWGAASVRVGPER